jgi:hypothetical protein
MQDRYGVLLYNPISNEGHLDSWHVLFIEIFLAAGWNVIPVTTDPKGLQLKLKHKNLWGHPHLVWTSDEKPKIATLNSRALHFSQRVLRQINRLFESTAQREQRLLAARYLEPKQFKEAVRTALESCSGQVDLIFNMFVDGYLPNSQSWENLRFDKSKSLHQSSVPDAVEAIPWVGLCITPEYEKRQHTQSQLQHQSQLQPQVECQSKPQPQSPPPLLHDRPAYYSLSTYRGTCFLEEAAVDAYRNVFSNKQFAFLPDITETERLSEPNALVLEIKRRAAGRRIVFMGGSIGKQKNLSKWIALIFNVDPTQWYFVQVGRISLNNLTAEDTQALARVKQQPPENLYVHADYLPDETSFNAIIAASDVIFAVYRDFYRSSNMLSKAAYFEKPILVADYCLMGDRVIRYGIGLAVRSNSLEEMQAGLVAAVQLQDLPRKFASYRADFNRVEFGRRLIDFATTCINPLRSLA